MSYDGEELVVVALLREDADVATTARRLVRTKRRAERDDDVDAGVAAVPDERTTGPGIRLPYVFGKDGTHPVPLTTLDALVDLPWVTSEDGASEVRVLAPEQIAPSILSCRQVTRNLDALAHSICDACHADDTPRDVRVFIGDRSALEDPRDADTDERRLAQMFAALVRGLNVAKQKRAGLIVVRRETSY